MDKLSPQWLGLWFAECSCPLMKFALQNPGSIIHKASHAHRQAGPSRPDGHVALQAGLERVLKWDQRHALSQPPADSFSVF